MTYRLPEPWLPAEIGGRQALFTADQVLQAYRDGSEETSMALQEATRKVEELERRIRIAYEALSKDIEFPDLYSINLTRLYDWLGGEDVYPESLLCAADGGDLKETPHG